MFRTALIAVSVFFVVSCGTSEFYPGPESANDRDGVQESTDSTNPGTNTASTPGDGSLPNGSSSDTGGVSMGSGESLLQTALIFKDSGGVAIRGADPVAYFTEPQNAPVVGSETFKLVWQGATWHFASEANRAEFEKNPLKYAPQFGGYCAYAASLGYKAGTVPEAWDVVDGKLYLNASLGVRDLWRRDISGNIAKGVSNWPGIVK